MMCEVDMRHADALMVAEGFVERLRPVCTRIEIKGSLCRLKAEVKDIDILAIPDLSPLPRPRAEFGKPIPKVYKTALDKLLEEMAAEEVMVFKKGGDRYKQLWLKHAGIAVELWLVLPPAQWGVQAVIRTGPAEFGHWMVTRKSKGGALPDQFIVADGVVGERVFSLKGEVRRGEIPMPEEIDFLSFCDLNWIEPKDRVARWKK